MKNLSFLSFILLIFCVSFFSSCKKEEEDNRIINKEKIIGTWQYDYVKTVYYQKGAFVKEKKKTIYNQETEYKADGTYYDYNVVNGERILLFEGTWRTHGSNTVFLDEAISIDSKADIRELSATKFILFIKSEITIGEEDYDIETEFSYKR